jgi:hypothetical protein
MNVPSLRRKANVILASLLVFLSLTAYLPASAIVSIPTQVSEFEEQVYEPLPDFDARQFPHRAQTTARAEQKKRFLRVQKSALSSLTLRWDERMDLPHALLSYDAPMTAPSDEDPAEIAKRFVIENRSLFEITAAQIDSSRVSASAIDPYHGFTRLTLEQRANDIRVFDSEMTFIIDRRGRVCSQSGCFIPAIDLRALIAEPALTAQESLYRAAAFCDTALAAPISVETEKLPSRERTVFSSQEIDSRTEASLVYFPVSRKDVRLSWQVIFYNALKPLDSYLVLIDARTGELLLRESLVYAVDGPPGRVFTKENPTAGQREMVMLAGDAVASPNGWVSADRTEGNNCQVFYNPQLTGGETIQSAGSQFDFPLNLTPGSNPMESFRASATNLFYWVNQCHDRFYALGFTEDWRNFQVNNLGRGGRGNDPVRAETLRGAAIDPTQTTDLVRNNAFFSSALEGSQPLLAMLMWTPTINGQTQPLDSSYDAGVIVHEYTHGVSIRLTGTDTSFGLRTTQGRGMGEGWSDFFGASFLDDGSRPVDDPHPVGVYLTNRPTRGIRSYPYTTRMDTNPLTFGDIQYASEVHAQGTVWCTILWDLRQELIARYGFEAGRRRAEKLVIDGLKLTPIAPIFTDARDALLLADQMTNQGADQQLIWRVLARRGLGFSAETSLAVGSTGFRLFAIEGFDIPPAQTAGSLWINDRLPAPAVAGEVLPIVVADRDLTAATSVETKVMNLRTGESLMLQLGQRRASGRFEGLLRVLMPGQDGGPGAALTVQPGDEISITYTNERNDAGTQEAVEVRTVAARRVVVYESTFEQGVSDWFFATNSDGSPNRWRLTDRRSVSPAQALYFGKQKQSRSFTPLGSRGVAVPPQIDLRNLSKPRFEFDFYFNGSPGGPTSTGTTSGPDTMTALGFNVRTTAEEPSLVAAFDIRPQSDTVFRHVVIDLRFTENRRAGINLQFVASSADEKRKKYEGFYLDNFRVTAASTQ